MKVPKPGGLAELSLRPSLENLDISSNIKISLHPMPAHDSLLVKLEPPLSPTKGTHHVGCDIVLVIDVSASMKIPAVAPGEEESTSGLGLTVLDIVRHAALTIIRNLDERDKLGIIVFSDAAETLLPLSPMNLQNRLRAESVVRRIRAEYRTNLWAGLQMGLDMFERADVSAGVPAIMLLSDGEPNYQNPQKGFADALRQRLPFNPTIYTFGFGYSSGASPLASIAKIGDGNYAFIPDPGMVGTVFVHAVANLQSTYATRATLQLCYSDPVKLMDCVGHRMTASSNSKSGDCKQSIVIGNIQYGQSRDIVLRVQNMSNLIKDGDWKNTLLCVDAKATMKPTLEGHAAELSVCTRRSLALESYLSEAEMAYHVSRAQLCMFLSSLFPIQQTADINSRKQQLGGLISSIPARKYFDRQNRSLMQDLNGTHPAGQISLAISSTEFFYRWGANYLQSLLGAHARQICNSFKDPGPLQYNAESPLFITCRDRLEHTFNSMPPPTPVQAASYMSTGSMPYLGARHQQMASHLNRVSKSTYASHSAAAAQRRAHMAYAVTQAMRYHGGVHVPGTINGGGVTQSIGSRPEIRHGDKDVFMMSMYQSRDSVCFAEDTPVLLANYSSMPIQNLCSGTRVHTPAGARSVLWMVRTHVKCEYMCVLNGNILVTPWHPVSLDGVTWQFPANLPGGTRLSYTGNVYSVLLEADENPHAHALQFGSVWGASLGHGITTKNGRRLNDVRAHGFFGDYSRVLASLTTLPHVNGVFQSHGVMRDAATGLVSGFLPTLMSADRGEIKNQFSQCF